MWHQSSASLLLALVAPSITYAAAMAQRDDSVGNAVVNLSQNNGAATFLGSGFIYGFPDNGTSAEDNIPDYFLTDIKFRACRGGGAQIDAVGWASGGYDGYIGRFYSALSNYRSARKYDGEFILMLSDLWGAQGGATAASVFPGDNGNWTEMELFLDQVISDIKSNDILEGLIVDIWNEPDLETFWYPDWSQYVEYFVKATQYLRANYPDLPVEGPSMANSPSTDNTNWQAWMSSISGNDTIPDRFSWHQIGSWQREPDVTVPAFTSLRETYSVAERPIDVNEYAWPSEQNPANSIFYLSQFERHNIRALRANWGGGSNLHNYMASLIYADGSGYYPNGDWQLYKYYGGMLGDRIATTASSDLLFDAFAAVSDGNILKVIAGTRTVQASYDLIITGFSKYGLATEGTLDVQSYRFDWSGSEVQIDSPVDLGKASYGYSSDTLTITLNPPTNSTGYAFEIQL
ncbi:glycoside hydrolase family 39 protein [Penicillium malachiteum]|uniref:glycoside hydrolase family 39 protein n=1 Tax=Penicillium malachiteum TaxID=1324776 RepID=UPI0025480A7A|nr:glycoside hydrolase family 39 protein [Penicillium malachiteum]KAJ5720313.1 glycoside hydrolase family 39 protein [Penicillium malachiteum]